MSVKERSRIVIFLCYVTIRITRCSLAPNKVMNIRFSLHSTLMSSIFWHRLTKYRHRIDFWPRSTEKYPHFHDLLSDQTGLKFRNIPVLRVRMSALSLSLFGALFPGLVIFYSQNDCFRKCFDHQKGFLPQLKIRRQANSQQRGKSYSSLIHAFHAAYMYFSTDQRSKSKTLYCSILL